MTASTRRTAALSFATQVSTKGINLGLSIVFVRLVPSDCVGLFTLLIAAAQLVCSLGRLGTNYSFAVLLPRQADSASRLKLTLTYSLFSLVTSLLVAGAALGQLAHTRGMPAAWQHQPWLLSGIAVIYLLSDSFSETIWSIHLALGRFRAVFLRDVWLALGKGVLPLAGALWLGAAGVVAGLAMLSVVNCWIAAHLLRQHRPDAAGFTWWDGFSWPLLYQLLGKGLPFFSVPLVSNLILWPLLMTVVNDAGIDKLDGLRVAQICAQVIGVISAALMPVLLVKSSHDEQAGQGLHQWAFQACWMISLLIYGMYALSDTTLLPLIFGHSAGSGAIQIARILVAAAAVQGLSQIPMQRPLSTRKLIQLSLLQIAGLVLAAVVASQIISPTGALMAYASVNLIGPLITVLCLPAALGQRLVPGSSTPWLQIAVSTLLLSTCFLAQTGPWQIGLLLFTMVVVLAGNRDLLSQLQPRR